MVFGAAPNSCRYVLCGIQPVGGFPVQQTPTLAGLGREGVSMSTAAKSERGRWKITKEFEDESVTLVAAQSGEGPPGTQHLHTTLGNWISQARHEGGGVARRR